MIDGCADWLERGLAPPQIVTDATVAYLQSEDAIAAWIEDCGERDPQRWEKSSDLFVSWSGWATKAGEYVGSQKRFAQNLETRGLIFQRRMDGRGYLGLRLLSAYGDIR
jgi:putative DNA primase/helicase